MPAVDEMAIGLLELFVNKCKKKYRPFYILFTRRDRALWAQQIIAYNFEK